MTDQTAPNGFRHHGARPVSVPPATLPPVTADTCVTTSAAPCCEDHDPDAEAIQCCDDCPNDFEDPETVDAARDAEACSCPPPYGLSVAPDPRCPKHGEVCCEGHDKDGEAERCCEACPDILPTRVLSGPPEHGEILVIDVWEINQRELERRVADGEPLPEMADGTPVTAEMVTAWRAERGHGPTHTVSGQPVEMP